MIFCARPTRHSLHCAALIALTLTGGGSLIGTSRAQNLDPATSSSEASARDADSNATGSPPTELSAIVVTGATSEAATKFDDKRDADALTETVSEEKLKDANVQSGSDIVKDVSGVSVSKGANGTSNVSVRGIDQRMLRITVDGQRQGGTGNPLDSIPPEIVQSLEVTKTFTPDMEADAVGGVININTGGVIIKDGYWQGRQQLTYNTLAPQPGSRNSLSIGQPFALLSEEHNASVLTTASFDDQSSRRERVSTLRQWTPQTSPGPVPYIGVDVPVLTLPVIESTLERRQRTGLVLNGDLHFDRHSFYWRSNFSRDSARRNRDSDDTNPAVGTPVALTPQYGVFANVPLSRRNQDQESQRDAGNFSFGGKANFENRDIDFVLALTTTREHEPHTSETGFHSDHTYQVGYELVTNPYEPRFSFVDETDPTDSVSATDPSRYRFNYLFVTATDLSEQDGSAKLNFKLTRANGVDFLKFGGKLQRRRRTVDIDRNVYDPGTQALDMNRLIDEPLVTMRTVSYRYGPVPSAAAVAERLSAMPTAFQLNDTQTQINSGSGDYTVTEKLWALYGMGKKVAGNWTVLGGLRIEGTRVDSTGHQMALDGSGQFQGFTFVSAVNDYVEVLPGIHFRYEPQSGVLYRGSITRSMSRPNGADIAPYRTLSFVDHRSRIGAPDLKPYLATNLDVSVDWYSAEQGLVSLAVFYKKIDHFITDAQYPVTIGDLGEFIEFKRVNGESARAIGGELSWQSPNWRLPAGLGRAAAEVNYNYTHGEARHPTRPGEVFSLPRQVEHQASMKLHDAIGSFSLDASLSYRTGWWEDLIAAGFDNYIESAWDAEISSAYKIGKSTRITAGVSNLFDRPTRHYAGNRERMNDSQRNGRDMNLGVQWKL